jgi:hypothetical protein
MFNIDDCPRFGIYAGDEAREGDYIETVCGKGGTVIKCFRDSEHIQRVVKFKNHSTGYLGYASLTEIRLLEPYSR